MTKQAKPDALEMLKGAYEMTFFPPANREPMTVPGDVTVFAEMGEEGYYLTSRPNGRGKMIWPGYRFSSRAEAADHCARHGLFLAN